MHAAPPQLFRAATDPRLSFAACMSTSDRTTTMRQNESADLGAILRVAKLRLQIERKAGVDLDLHAAQHPRAAAAPRHDLQQAGAV